MVLSAATGYEAQNRSDPPHPKPPQNILCLQTTTATRRDALERGGGILEERIRSSSRSIKQQQLRAREGDLTCGGAGVRSHSRPRFQAAPRRDHGLRVSPSLLTKAKICPTKKQPLRKGLRPDLQDLRSAAFRC